jgi:polar amino acid transport system substrate-binding protein
MKQILQNYKTGELRLAEVPAAFAARQGVLVATRASLISAGTEKMKVDVAKKNLLGKAMERPDQVRKVIESVRQQGLLQTYEKVMNKLDTPTPLGYSSAGRRARGRSRGGGLRGRRPRRLRGRRLRGARRTSPTFRGTWSCPMAAGHACSTAPPSRPLGAIALQGVRQAEIRMGEDVVVIGLGLVGLLTVQLLKCSGAHVIGIELDPSRAALAKTLGCDRVVIGPDLEVREAVRLATGGRGADAVLGHRRLVLERARSCSRASSAATVAASSSSGITKMELPHRAYYDKELTLLLSRSYGPGRYDPSYEEQGVDYPLGYVRWTERRNMEEFLRLVESGHVQVDPLISHRVPFAEAERAYALITGKATEPYLGIVLTYPDEAAPAGRVALKPEGRRRAVDELEGCRARRARRSGIGFIGAGQFRDLDAAAAPQGAARRQAHGRRDRERPDRARRGREVRLRVLRRGCRGAVPLTRRPMRYSW